MSENFMMSMVFIAFTGAFLTAGFGVGLNTGIFYEQDRSREKFIIYCTGKGDEYAACDDIWNGRKSAIHAAAGGEGS